MSDVIVSVFRGYLRARVNRSRLCHLLGQATEAILRLGFATEWKFFRSAANDERCIGRGAGHDSCRRHAGAISGVHGRSYVLSIFQQFLPPLVLLL